MPGAAYCDSGFFLDRLTGIGEELVSRSLDFPGDELFKGRAGCLYALLFVQRKLGDDTIKKDLVMKVWNHLLVDR